MQPLLPNPDSLSLAQQVAQMVVVRASGYLFDHQIQYPAWEPPTATLQYWLQDVGVGGVILLGGSAVELAVRTRQLQDWAPIPLLLAADIEEGVGQRFSGATWFPPVMALSAVDPAIAASYAEQMGRVTAREARAIGLNWVLAPVVDVNNNPNNPVINVRAFGETPETVSRLATAFICGAQAYPVLTAAKHFPGHGDTAVDSHLDLPVISHSYDRLQQIEFPPFKAAIAAGVDSVMSAHLQIPALDADLPATLSPKILTQELRQNWQFSGLIVTDALVMRAIADRYGANEAAVLAVEAGADILLMPADPIGAIQAVCAAVESGRILVERIRESLARIWQAKQKVGASVLDSQPAHAWEATPPGITAPSLIAELAQPDAIATATNILKSSLQLRGSVPPNQPGRNLILLDDAVGSPFLGRHTAAIALPESYGYRTQIIDSSLADVPNLSPQPTLLQIFFIRGNPFRESKLLQTAQNWFQFLIQTGQLQAVVIYGSPYLLDKFLPELPPEIPYVFTYGQMSTAQAIALNALFRQQ